VSPLLLCRGGLLEIQNESQSNKSRKQEKNMVKVVFQYNVAKEKQAEYLQITRDKIKPFWEANGCQSYTVWQVGDSETGFVKEMLFESMPGMKETMALKQADPIKELYFKFATDVSRKVITKKV
jgi:quinol monooxygenase YgiN